MSQKSLCRAPVPRSGGEGTRAGRGPGALSSLLRPRRRTKAFQLLQTPFPTPRRLWTWREAAVSSCELGVGHGWGGPLHLFEPLDSRPACPPKTARLAGGATNLSLVGARKPPLSLPGK